MNHNINYILDSIRVTSSCSPEGEYGYNKKLSISRSKSVSDYLKKNFSGLGRKIINANIPEDWERLRLIVKNDSILSERTKAKLLTVTSIENIDDFEASFVNLPEYRYLRENIYPKLRSVNFEFFLHKRGVVKDTIHTTILDSTYMSGVESLAQLDYKKAVTKLLKYEDYNAALACLTAGYEETALKILENLKRKDAKSYYLLSIIYARNKKYKLAKNYFDKAVLLKPSLRHRANLDPELSDII